MPTHERNSNPSLIFYLVRRDEEVHGVQRGLRPRPPLQGDPCRGPAPDGRLHGLQGVQAPSLLRKELHV